MLNIKISDTRLFVIMPKWLRNFRKTVKCPYLINRLQIPFKINYDILALNGSERREIFNPHKTQTGPSPTINEKFGIAYRHIFHLAMPLRFFKWCREFLPEARAAVTYSEQDFFPFFLRNKLFAFSLAYSYFLRPKIVFFSEIFRLKTGTGPKNFGVGMV